LEQLIEGKRPTPELWLWLGIAKEALGDVEGARAAWTEVTQRATKKSPALADAQRRLGSTADPSAPPS
jgi:predicted Zn-dependent protease